RRIPGQVPLAAPFDRVLGQPLRPASRNLGLLPTDALRPPGDDQRRPAGLTQPPARHPRTAALREFNLPMSVRVNRFTSSRRRRPGNVRFTPIVLPKSFCTADQKFSGL